MRWLRTFTAIGVQRSAVDLRSSDAPIGGVRFRLPFLANVAFALVLGGCVDSSRDDAVASPTAPGTPTTPTTPTVPPEGDEFDIQAMLTNLVDAVIVPGYEALAQESASFAAANGPLATYCSALGTGSEAAALADAQQGWRDLMARVQVSELHVLGPALENGGALRNRILSYAGEPLSTCGVDQSVILAEQSNFDLSARSVNQRGMGSIDYLLFNTNLDHTCAPQVPATQNWDARPDAERGAARCALAKAQADDVALAAASLRDRWLAAQGDFRSEFLAIDNSGASLQAITDALFFIEINTKDQKLGVPTGVNDDCSTFACAELVESRYSENSLLNVRNNLRAFIDFFNGGAGLGFDDLINDAEFSTVTQAFQQNVVNAIANIDATEASLFTQTSGIDTQAEETECMNSFASPEVASDLPACSLVGLVKRITDDLRIDFVTIVNVELPERAQSDND